MVFCYQTQLYQQLFFRYQTKSYQQLPSSFCAKEHYPSHCIRCIVETQLSRGPGGCLVDAQTLCTSWCCLSLVLAHLLYMLICAVARLGEWLGTAQTVWWRGWVNGHSLDSLDSTDLHSWQELNVGKYPNIHTAQLCWVVGLSIGLKQC